MQRRWVWFGLAMALAGCGAAPEVPDVLGAAACPPAATAGDAVTPAPTPRPAKTSAPAKTAKPKPAASTSKPAPKASKAPTGKAAPVAADPADPVDPATPDAKALLEEVKTTSLGLQTLKGTLQSSEMRYDKSRVPLNTEIALTYQNPGQYRFEMIRSTKSSNNGARLVYRQGESKVQVRPGGILGIVNVGIGITDAQMLTDNDYRLDQITMEGVLNRVTSDGYQVELAGTSTVGSDAITVLKITHPDHTLDKRIDYEYIGFDANKLYRLWAAYAKTELGLPQNLLHRIAITSVTPNAPLKADAFKL